jgi:hypothetical protein
MVHNHMEFFMHNRFKKIALFFPALLLVSLVLPDGEGAAFR